MQLYLFSFLFLHYMFRLQIWEKQPKHMGNTCIHPNQKRELALQKQQLPWRRLYRGGKPPEDGCMKPKHVV
jgi:hypothetical protein